MVIGIALLIVFSLFASIVRGQYASTFPLPIPLFHKSPYLNAVLPANANGSIYNQGDPALVMPSGYPIDWMIAVRVDSKAYLLQGQLFDQYVAAKTIAAYITSTRTVLTMDAGPLRVNITYLTPIELMPDNWKLHSLPFIYYSIDVRSIDGNPHTIQLYSDVGGRFVSSNRDDMKMTLQWGTTSKSIYHQAEQSIIQTLVEHHDIAEDGTQYFATSITSGVALTWQSAPYNITRGTFLSTGRLANTLDTANSSISNASTRMAFALDFGSTTEISNSKPLVFVLGLVRDPVMKYGTQNRSSLWWSESKWSNVPQAIDYLLANYPSALSRATALDHKIVTAAASIGLPSAVAMKLTDLMILSLRQTIGSLEFTTIKLSQGYSAEIAKWRVFMKNLGSMPLSVNPVDNLYASFPAFLYLDPSLAGKLLEPLLEFQASGNATSIYAAPDLGHDWPNVSGNNDQPYLSVESCGSMLVMALAHARKSGDGRLIATYHDLLGNWTDVLVAHSLQPTVSVDWITGTSNLALKGILGIYAMGQINKALGRDPTYYLDTAKNQVQNWLNLTLSSDHVMSQFGNTSSWGLLYNLYDARLLGANIIPETIYETQALWYASQIPKAPRFGLPIDNSEPDLIKAPWTLLTAASVFNSTNSSARDAMIGMVHSRSFLTEALGHYENPSMYFASNGSMFSGIGNPAMGGMFAFLALNAPDLPIKVPPSSTRSISATRSAMIGGIVGGLAALALILISTYFLLCRRKRLPAEHHFSIDSARPFETPASMTEFHPYAQSELIAASPAEYPSSPPPPYTDHTL